MKLLTQQWHVCQLPSGTSTDSSKQGSKDNCEKDCFDELLSCLFWPIEGVLDIYLVITLDARMNDSTESKCPSCGVIQIPVENASLLLTDKENAARNNQLIWIRHEKVDGLPKWACTKCQPTWLTINSLENQYHDLQTSKENAVELEDFQRASEILGKQRELTRKLVELLDCV